MTICTWMLPDWLCPSGWVQTIQRTFFRQKAGCVFVNILRTRDSSLSFVAATYSAFYGIAAAAGLRRTNGNIGNTIGNIRPVSVILSLTTIPSTPLASFQKVVLQDKKERSALQTVHKKATHKLLIPVALFPSICYTNGSRTTRERK